MQVRILEDFDAAAAAWDALHSRVQVASIFNARAWQQAWWRVYGDGRPLRILLAERGGEPAGLLALYIDPVRRLGMPVRMARLVGTGGDTYPDDLGPLAKDGEVLRALARAAAGLGADVLELEDLDPRSGFAEALAREGATLRPAQRICYLRLPATWDEYLASVSAHRRARIRKSRRKLAAARFRIWDDAASIGAALERLAWLHHRRWRAAGEESSSFATPQYMDFHRAVMAATLRMGALRLYCLDLDGETVAMQYAYRFRRGIYVMQAGFDPAHADKRVGHVLLHYAIEHAIGEGNDVFDFLRGEHSYKDDIATASRQTLSATLLRPGLSGAAWRLRERALPRWKGTLKALLRPAA